MNFKNVNISLNVQSNDWDSRLKVANDIYKENSVDHTELSDKQRNDFAIILHCVNSCLNDNFRDQPKELSQKINYYDFGICKRILICTLVLLLPTALTGNKRAMKKFVKNYSKEMMKLLK